MGYELYINSAQLDDLYKCLKTGMPLEIALQHAGISVSLYKYLLALGSVSHTEKEAVITKELKGVMDEDLPTYSGANLDSLEVGKWITPKPKYQKKYHYDKEFKILCDQAYKIIVNINTQISENILFHLQKVNMNGMKSKSGKVIATASMWYLERTLPSFFGKKDNFIPESNTVVRPVEIAYIDPDTDESKRRVDEMQSSIENGIPDNNVA